MLDQIFGTEIITSKTNSTIVKIAKLTNKKHRNEYNLFACDGVKLFLEASRAQTENLTTTTDSSSQRISTLQRNILSSYMSMAVLIHRW